MEIIKDEADKSIFIKVSHVSGRLETMVIAYPSKAAAAMTLVNIRTDDLESIAKTLASRICTSNFTPKYGKYILFSTEDW